MTESGTERSDWPCWHRQCSLKASPSIWDSFQDLKQKSKFICLEVFVDVCKVIVALNLTEKFLVIFFVGFWLFFFFLICGFGYVDF